MLILRHKTGKWLLPGGKINKGESWIDGLKREVREETGVTDFNINGITDVDSWIEDGAGYYVVSFLASIIPTPIITLSEEHGEYVWVDLSDLDKYQFWNEKIKDRIRKVIS